MSRLILVILLLLSGGFANAKAEVQSFYTPTIPSSFCTELRYLYKTSGISIQNELANGSKNFSLPIMYQKEIIGYVMCGINSKESILSGEDGENYLIYQALGLNEIDNEIERLNKLWPNGIPCEDAWNRYQDAVENYRVNFTYYTMASATGQGIACLFGSCDGIVASIIGGLITVLDESEKGMLEREKAYGVCAIDYKKSESDIKDWLDSAEKFVGISAISHRYYSGLNRIETDAFYLRNSGYIYKDLEKSSIEDTKGFWLVHDDFDKLATEAFQRKFKRTPDITKTEDLFEYMPYLLESKNFKITREKYLLGLNGLSDHYKTTLDGLIPLREEILKHVKQ
ncbi:hypothetical protein [Deinococcus sp. AJ005]|uniref:hypothetical protein n=1 Tax=Deinococcus sp. AJ005 TaxID=2652443 RepID=UPI00125CB603|nr:hypothetical protein [Deinococcus sp. AJ005]QFP76278.1 hypothetical protein DAAJ005_07305 [Deinococcus sp. AJ005]